MAFDSKFNLFKNPPFLSGPKSEQLSLHSHTRLYLDQF